MNKTPLCLTLEHVSKTYRRPLIELMQEAASVHSQVHGQSAIKVSRLISVKTGHCVEDCSYCAQSAKYNSGIESHNLLSQEEVMGMARKALDEGIKRVCLSASWKLLPKGDQFGRIKEMVDGVKQMGLDVCLTMGSISEEQAAEISGWGITAYNHNIDTSESFYPNVITTRTFSDRLETLLILAKHGVSICSGGIIGMGETEDDRISMLHTLVNLPFTLYTIPYNMLVPIEGTPFESLPSIDVFEMVRLIAATRILIPSVQISLAAGRRQMSAEAQALCFLAGANAIFAGEKLLTTSNATPESDNQLINRLGLKIN